MSETNGHPVSNGSNSAFPDAETTCVAHYLGEAYSENQESNYDEIEALYKNVESKCKEVAGAENLETSRQKILTVDVIKSMPKSVISGEEDWERFDVETTIVDSDLTNLMARAACNHYQAFGEEEDDLNIHLVCSSLFKKDYICRVLSNTGGALCWNYPENIIVPVALKANNPNDSNEGICEENSGVPGFEENITTYHQMAKSAALARCRSRFPVPVLLYKRKYICRSGTLAVRKGAAFEAARKAAEPESQLVGDQYALLRYIGSKGVEFCIKAYETLGILLTGVEEMKSIDASILKTLKIRYICDLMVENRKIHTGMSVGSSEKVNMLKYGEFCCLRIPYPGCEFFTKYSSIRFLEDFETKQKKLIFNWDAPENDSILGVTEETLPFPELDWESYTTWDLITLTKNYMRMLLNFLDEGDGGLLVHCISGWDRTPLFISLLRISLWADSLIHNELDTYQMAFFTLGYDWYLFGHHLPNRLAKKEEIMHFCFKFLPEMAAEEFSLRKNKGIESVVRDRKNSLLNLSNLLLRIYEETIIPKVFSHCIVSL